MEVTQIYQIIEYEPRACFKTAGERVSSAGRAGDIHHDLAILTELEKLVGNSYYSKTLTNKEKHTKLSYHDDHNVVDQRKLDMAISSAQFIKLEI